MKLLTVLLLGLLCLVLLLFVVPIRIICTVNTAGKVDFSLALRVLFVKIGIFPRKKRLPDLRRFRRGALEKLYEKQRRKAEKKAKDKEKRAARKEMKKKAAEKSGHPRKKRGVRHILRLVTALTEALLGRFGRYLRVDIAYFDITAASKDPANTAILYGWIWAAMENFWGLIQNTRMFGRVKKNSISIYADFLAEKPSVRGKITFSIALWQVMALLIAGGGAALSVENDARRQESAEEREARRREEAAARAQLVRELKKR